MRSSTSTIHQPIGPCKFFKAPMKKPQVLFRERMIAILGKVLDHSLSAIWIKKTRNFVSDSTDAIKNSQSIYRSFGQIECKDNIK